MCGKSEWIVQEREHCVRKHTFTDSWKYGKYFIYSPNDLLISSAQQKNTHSQQKHGNVEELQTRRTKANRKRNPVRELHICIHFRIKNKLIISNE